MVTSMVGVIATTILTIVIIAVTVRNHKRTVELEKEINHQEVKIHERQLRVDTYTHKREIYRNAMSVIALCEQLMFFQEKIDFNERSDEVIAGIVEDTLNNYVPNRRSVIQNLYESKFLFPKELSEKIITIRTEFDNMCAVLGQYQTLNNHLSFEEKRATMSTMRDEFLKQINESCFTIMEQREAVDAAMEKDMTFILAP